MIGVRHSKSRTEIMWKMSHQDNFREFTQCFINSRRQIFIRDKIVDILPVGVLHQRADMGLGAVRDDNNDLRLGDDGLLDLCICEF